MGALLVPNKVWQTGVQLCQEEQALIRRADLEQLLGHIIGEIIHNKLRKLVQEYLNNDINLLPSGLIQKFLENPRLRPITHIRGQFPGVDELLEINFFLLCYAPFFRELRIAKLRKSNFRVYIWNELVEVGGFFL